MVNSVASCAVSAVPGQLITAGTCGVFGAECRGDTVLALFNANGTVETSNDDFEGGACGGGAAAYCSLLSFVAPPAAVSAAAAQFILQLSCWANSSCAGRVAVQVSWCGARRRALCHLRVGPGLTIRSALLSFKLEKRQ